MRSLRPTEQRLLVILLSAVFLALNLAAGKILMNVAEGQKKALENAETRIAESQMWIEEGNDLDPESKNLPDAPQMEPRTAGPELVKLVRGAAESAGLTVVDESLPGQPEDLAEPAEVLRVKTSGSFPGLVKFLFEIQSPGAWRSVEAMTIKADASPQNVLAELEIRQYYSESGPGPAAGGVAEANP